MTKKTSTAPATEHVELKNVITPDGVKNVTVELVPFNYRNNEHTEFAFALADMMGRMPSPFSSINDAAKRFVELFMVHKEEDANNPNSDYSLVINDLRASRTLYNNATHQKQLFDFFENA